MREILLAPGRARSAASPTLPGPLASGGFRLLTDDLKVELLEHLMDRHFDLFFQRFFRLR
jgi:hypothetical protein